MRPSRWVAEMQRGRPFFGSASSAASSADEEVGLAVGGRRIRREETYPWR